MFWFISSIHKQRVIPVFLGGKRTCSGAGARPRKDRNPVPEAVGEGLPAFALFFKMGHGIHCSGLNLDSGIFRVVQYRASTQADLREKTGMTVVSVVCNERRWYIFVAPKAPLLPGEVPDEA